MSFKDYVKKEKKIMSKEIIPKKDIVSIDRGEVRQSGEDGFGLALVDAAKASYNDERKQKALNAVKELMRIRDRALAMVIRWNEVVEFNKEKIQALESGEFEYEIATGVLNFKDERLNIEWTTPKGI